MTTSLFLFFGTSILCFILFHLLFNKEKSKAKLAPLAPGPTGLPIIGNLLQFRRNPHQTLLALTKVYGPLIRFRLGYVEHVVVSSAAVAAQFFRTHDINFSNRPPSATAEHMTFNYQDIVYVPYGPQWRMMRKLCTLHLFSHKALENSRHIREKEVSLLVNTLCTHANQGSAVKMGYEVTACSANSLSMSMFSKRVFGHEAENNEDATKFKEMVLEYFRLAGSFIVSNFVPALRLFDMHGKYVVEKMKKLHLEIDYFFNKVIKDNLVTAKEGDMLSVLMSLKEEGGGNGAKLTDTDIKALLFELFTGGTDSSSHTVEWALAEMIRNPKILKKVQAELDSVVGQDRLVHESDLPKLPLLQAIIRETLRLHPPAPLSVPRVATEACEINGYHIPNDTVTLLNIWAIGRDPSIWPNPLEFMPERFLPGGPNENIDMKGTDFELLPFGAGRRICAGMTLGIRMVQLLTATLLHTFDWVLPDGHVAEKLDLEEEFGFVLEFVDPMKVHPIFRLTPKALETISN